MCRFLLGQYHCEEGRAKPRDAVLLLIALGAVGLVIIEEKKTAYWGVNQTRIPCTT